MKEAVQQLTAKAKGGKVTSYTYDLASFAQIQQFADAVKTNHQRIDVLINNAGVFESKKSLSKDGFELTWAVNVLAPFLLTALLKDLVTERIVNVSSISAGSRMDFDNLQQVSNTLCFAQPLNNHSSSTEDLAVLPDLCLHTTSVATSVCADT